MSPQKKKSAKRANRVPPIQRLMLAMDRCAVARGEAMYTLGYRAGAGEPTETQLFAKQERQWDDVDIAERAFRRVALRVLREARLSQGDPQ